MASAYKRQVRALLDPVLVEAIVIQYLVQIKRRRGRRGEQEGEITEGAGKATIKFLFRIYAHERRLSRNSYYFVNGWDKSMPDYAFLLLKDNPKSAQVELLPIKSLGVLQFQFVPWRFSRLLSSSRV